MSAFFTVAPPLMIVFSVETQIVAPGPTSSTASLVGRMLSLGSGPGKSVFTSRPRDTFVGPRSFLKSGSSQPATALDTPTSKFDTTETHKNAK